MYVRRRCSHSRAGVRRATRPATRPCPFTQPHPNLRLSQQRNAPIAVPTHPKGTRERLPRALELADHSVSARAPPPPRRTGTSTCSKRCVPSM
eukprot:6310774-Prymnesium_polylepis.1